MKFLYDIWVNWFEGEERGYNVCHYYEWYKKDKMEVLEKVPVLHIHTHLFHYIENSLNELPPRLLEQIENSSYQRRGMEKQILKYAAIISDGREILAFDTSGYQIAIKKSRLIPRQEQQVFALCREMERQFFSHKKLKETNGMSLLSLPGKYMYGLTRRERQLKKILMIAMDQLKSTEDSSELLYWLSEWDSKKWLEYSYLKDAKIIWNILRDDIIHGWSAQHEVFCHQLIKGYPFLEMFWEKERDNHNSRSK